jgi:hypothetical protein
LAQAVARLYFSDVVERIHVEKAEEIMNAASRSKMATSERKEEYAPLSLFPHLFVFFPHPSFVFVFFSFRLA